MAATTPKVVSFESSGNTRCVGSMDVRELVSIKQQLENLGRLVPTPSSNMYPTVQPEGIVEDVASITQKMSAIINQLISAFSRMGSDDHNVSVQQVVGAQNAPAQNAPMQTHAQVGAPITLGVPMETYSSAPAVNCRADIQSRSPSPSPASSVSSSPGTMSPRAAMYARDLAHVRNKSGPLVVSTGRTATYSRSLSQLRADKSVEDLPAAGTKDASVDRVFSEDEVRRAHVALDAILATRAHDFRDVENVTDIIIASEDEMYCVSRFRRMMQDRRGSDTKNFMRHFDRLCKKI